MQKLKLNQEEVAKIKEDCERDRLKDENVNDFYRATNPPDKLTNFVTFGGSEYGQNNSRMYFGYLRKALADKYGDGDFFYNEDLARPIYLFEHGGVMFIVSRGIDCVGARNIENHRDKICEFIMSMQQMTIDWVFAQPPPIHDLFKDTVNQAIDDGFYIDGKINWDWNEEFKTSYLQRKELQKRIHLVNEVTNSNGINGSGHDSNSKNKI